MSEQEIKRPSKVNRSNRPTRTPINGYRDKLGVKGLEAGWHYAWINDYNVDRYIEGGYDFVEHDVVIGDKQLDAASQVGGRYSKAVGNGVTGFLMRCPDEVYQEEMALLDADVDEVEKALRDVFKSKARDDGHYGDVQIGDSKPISRTGRTIVVR